MTMWWVYLLIGLIAVALALLAYWQFVIAEGAYLGARIVALLYDWAAPAYERIKRFDNEDEQWFLGLPLARALEPVANPLVLDVGTGTGRLPRALLFQPAFGGRVIGVDLSRRMLARAVEMTRPYAEKLTLIWQDAQALPFPDETFDAVTCLEMLEFTPNPRAVLEELVRVLRPGGVLLLTNRVGPDARWLPGKAWPRDEFMALLQSLPLESIRIRSWQIDYNLAWAIKSGPPRGGGVRPLPHILRCPFCGHSPLPVEGGAYACAGCGRAYPIARDGVIEMARPVQRTQAQTASGE